MLSDNVIYFWKGRKYEVEYTNNYSYFQNAIWKNEKFPSNSKNCGFLDNNGNKLCIPDNSDCPINIISEEKIKNSYSSFKLGNKTFNYGNEENSNNAKIISGLYVDKDIYLNQTEKNFYILDTNTISELLKENQKYIKG